jgi:hypothetical protein
MGANAQTSVPTFTAGDVLTAANMNISARTGVPVFASTVTRDAAFGGTGEKTLAEGQMCYVEGTGFQTYNGTSWVTWGTAPSTGALVYLTQGTFTTVASVSMPASTFTSTYKNYKVILSVTASSTTQAMGFRVNNAGTPRATSGYYGGWVAVDAGGASSTQGANNNSSQVPFYLAANIDSAAEFIVSNPTDTARKTTWSGTAFAVDSGGDRAGWSGGGTYDTAEANDGLTFVVGGTFSGIYYVYGIKDS